MIESTASPRMEPVEENTRDLVERILDRLPVTDRVFHHLDQSNPLVVELVERLRAAHKPPARVLIIGPNSVLAHVLIRLGYTVDLWHFQQGYLTDDLKAYVRDVVTPQQLVEAMPSLGDEPYDAIVAPLILESLPGDPRRFLVDLSRALQPNGSLFLATTNQSRLDLRLLALAGKSTSAAYPSFHVSFSWPPLPRLRYYQRDDLVQICRDGGLRVREVAFVMAHKPFTAIDPLTPGQYLARKVGHWFMRLFASTRPALLLHLSPRVGYQVAPGPDTNGQLRVSVILSVSQGGAMLRQSLKSLVEQEYPADRYEILVIHDGQCAENHAIIVDCSKESTVPIRELTVATVDGPATRNVATAAASGDICVHTDDSCQPHPGWIRAMVSAFDERTAVVTGPVLDTSSSYPSYLTLPGSRPTDEKQGHFPIANVAYRRRLFTETGGFDVAFVNGHAPAGLAWDTELAWRLQRLGWQGRFQKEAFLFRESQWPRGAEWIREEWHLARNLPESVARVPELQRTRLIAGCFAGRDTLLFDLLIVGVIARLLSGKRRWLVLGLPWLGAKSTYLDVWPVSQWPSSARVLATLVLRHLVWFVGLAVGSARARRLVL